MNYLDVGLPHTEFYPRRQLLSPPRNIPMSGLSRRYMGLEPVSKSEIEGIIRRLSQPKLIITENPEQVLKNVRQVVKGTGRFVGKKRMSRSQISKMVQRLCSRRTSEEDKGVSEEDSTERAEEEREDGEGVMEVPQGSVLEKRSSLAGEPPVSRRLSVRFQEEPDKTEATSDRELSAMETSFNVLPRKNSLKGKDQNRNSTSAVAMSRVHNPVNVKSHSASAAVSKVGHSAPKTSPVSPRSTPGTPRGGRVSPTLPRTQVQSSLKPTQRSGTKTPKTKSGKTEVAKKSDTKSRIRIDELDEHVIDRVARMNKSPRDPKV